MIYYWPMKKTFLFAILLLSFLSPSLADDTKYGSLNVFSKTPGTKIYVDGKLSGTDEVHVKEIQSGTHFMKVTSGEATAEATLYAEIVEIKAGEVTTIYITEKGLEGRRKSSSEDQVDVFKAKRILDYSKEMHTGWYLKFGYLSNLYYNYDSPTLDNYASTFGLGLGFRIPIAPSIDFSLEMERGQLTSSKSTWYIMPITANFSISYLPSPYFRGKQYYGLGLGYYMTDLETPLKENLSTLGYHLFYGLEMPMGDQNAIAFQFGYHVANLSRYNYSMNCAYASVGYRWDIKN
jgi:hypothetical protein